MIKLRFARIGKLPLAVFTGLAMFALPAAPAAAQSFPAVKPLSSSPNNFRQLFSNWKKLDRAVDTSSVSVPSAEPVKGSTFTSGFGTRTDPFRGRAARHAGIDLAGPIGTPIYATGDATVGRSQWVNGYGNLIELEHGRSIQTRYGHLTRSAVRAGQRVKRGQLIGYMGSTGRSTGSHLHYEVRVAGKAVNPIPYMQSGTLVAALQRRAAQGGSQVAMGGPSMDGLGQ